MINPLCPDKIFSLHLAELSVVASKSFWKITYLIAIIPYSIGVVFVLTIMIKQRSKHIYLLYHRHRDVPNRSINEWSSNNVITRKHRQSTYPGIFRKAMIEFASITRQMNRRNNTILTMMKTGGD